MAGVSAEMILLNGYKFPAMIDEPTIPLKKGDAFWTEISEEPALMVTKLWQLQCAFCALCEEKGEAHPKALIVCLSGEKETFDIAVDHVKAVLSAAAVEEEEAGAAGAAMGGADTAREQQATLKEAWTIFEFVPVLAIYTPFRNVYTTLRDLDRKVDNLERKVDNLDRKINRKLDFYFLAAALLAGVVFLRSAKMK